MTGQDCVPRYQPARFSSYTKLNALRLLLHIYIVGNPEFVKIEVIVGTTNFRSIGKSIFLHPLVKCATW